MSVATIGSTPVIAADDTTSKTTVKTTDSKDATTGSGTNSTTGTTTTSNGSFSDLLGGNSSSASSTQTKTNSDTADTSDSGTKLSNLMSTSDAQANPGLSETTLEQYVKTHPSYTPGVTRKGDGYTVTDLAVQASNSRATLSIQSGPALSIVDTWANFNSHPNVYWFKVNGQTSFCIEHGVGAGSIETGASSTSIGEGAGIADIHGLTQAKLEQITDMIHFGYAWAAAHPSGQSVQAWYGYTQLKIWDILGVAFNGSTWVNTHLTGISGGWTMTQYNNYTGTMQDRANKYRLKPVYADKTFTVHAKPDAGEDAGSNPGSITDTSAFGITQYDSWGEPGASTWLDPNQTTIENHLTDATYNLDRKTGQLTFTATGKNPGGYLTFKRNAAVTGASLFRSAGVQAQIVATAPMSSSFNVNLKGIPFKPRTKIQIDKSTTDGKKLANAKFEIKNSAGTVVSTLTTDNNGYALSGYLNAGKYTVTEVGAPDPYIKDKTVQNVTLADGDPVHVMKFVNTEAKGQIVLKKVDAESNNTTAQGDGKLDGAQFQIIDSNHRVVQTLVINNNQATSTQLPLGKYTIHESTAGEGYHLTKGSDQTVELKYANDTTPVVISNNTVKNNIDKGYLDFTKKVDSVGGADAKTPGTEGTTNNGDKGADKEHTLAGIQFKVKLVSGKTFEYNGKQESEITLTTDKDGHVKSDLLPYGRYQVDEVLPPEFQAIQDPKFNQHFQVVVGGGNQTVTDPQPTTSSYTITNRSTVKNASITKVDSETGKPVLTADAVFKIKNLATGDYYTEDGNDKFKTDTNGVIHLGKQIADNSTRDASGNVVRHGYQLEEVQAPVGYKIDPTPIHFDVTDAKQNSSGATTGAQNIEVTANDKTQVVQLQIKKTGNFITGTEDATDKTTGLKYKKFKVENKPLANVTFELHAAENINIGPYNYKKGDKVDEVVTNAKGTAITATHPAGKYYWVETKAPDGYAFDKNKQYPVDVPYDAALAAQNKDLPTETTSIGNNLQDLKLQLKKSGQELADYVNKPYGFTTKDVPVAGAVFGIYTDADIKDAAGKVIAPKDTLVGVTQTEKDGLATVEDKFPQGKFYAKELKTPDDSRYLLNKDKYDFTFDATTADATKNLFIYKDGVSEDKVDSTKHAIENHLATNRFQIKKLTETADYTKDGVTYKVGQNAVAAGATFELRDSKGKLAQTLVVGDDQTATSNALPIGDYTLKETKTPNSEYRLDDNTYKVAIKKDKVTITDPSGKAIQQSSVDVPKATEPTKDTDTKDTAAKDTDANTTTDTSVTDSATAQTSAQDSLLVANPVVGKNVIISANSKDAPKASDVIANWKSIFGVTDADKITKALFSPSDGGSQQTWDSLTKLGAKLITSTTDLTKAGHYVVLLQDKTGQATPVEIWVQGKTAGATQTIGQFSLSNYMKKGDLDFTKRDVSTGDVLPGAKINIKGGKVDITFISSKNGNRFTLPEGSYTFTEIAPPDGYEVTPEVGTFTIKDGEVTKATLHDKRKVLPKTGNDFMQATGVMVIVLIGSIAVLYFTNRKKA